MWKYVSRRFRDTVERTYNVLEHHRNWTCGGEKSGGNSGANALCSQQQDEGAGGAEHSLAVVLAEKITLGVSPFHHENGGNQGSSSSSSSSSSEDDFRRQQKCHFQQNMVGALTWSSAIVCGWYTSQMLCMRRRHLRQDGWTMGRCRFSRGFLSPGQAFHSNLLSHWVLNAPGEQTRAGSGVATGWIGRSLLVNDGVPLVAKATQVFPVTNDEASEKASIEVRFQIYFFLKLKLTNSSWKQSKSFEAPKPASVTDAVQDLLQVVGDIEFQLGVQHMQEEHYNVAATHFKLGTSHHHSGATFNLGLCYELGLGVHQSPQMALQCFSIAAEMGHPKALYNMGIYHVRGLAGLAKNRKTGRQYLMAAARLGQEDAIRALGWRSDKIPLATPSTEKTAHYGQQEYAPKSTVLQAVAVA